MQRMLFSRWVASGLVEGKSEQTGQQGNLRLQRVPTNVSVFSWAFCKPPTTHVGRKTVKTTHLEIEGRRKVGTQMQKTLEHFQNSRINQAMVIVLMLPLGGSIKLLHT